MRLLGVQQEKGDHRQGANLLTCLVCGKQLISRPKGRAQSCAGSEMGKGDAGTKDIYHWDPFNWSPYCVQRTQWHLWSVIYHHCHTHTTCCAHASVMQRLSAFLLGKVGPCTLNTQNIIINCKALHMGHAGFRSLVNGSCLQTSILECKQCFVCRQALYDWTCLRVRSRAWRCAGGTPPWSCIVWKG